MNLRNLPKIDDILRDERVARFRGRLPDARILAVVRDTVELLRVRILKKSVHDDHEAVMQENTVPHSRDVSGREVLRKEAVEMVIAALDGFLSNRLRRVINATGVITHTNLGRAPMAPAALDGMREVLEGYSNLEYSVADGARQSRTYYLEQIVRDLTGAEAAAFVNNNAAAVFLTLNTLCNRREALLSRGEIVEIGDGFRISEIIEQSGAVIREIGATNRTSLTDYEKHITPATGVILKVHSSNFKITGYTEAVPPHELAALSRSRELIFIEDMGSGVLTDLTNYGLPRERQVIDAIRDGADLVTFSGDKMLGGPQAGIIAGKKTLVDQIKRNQLMRCVRLDKARLYMLENALAAYFTSTPDIPVLRFVASDVDDKAEILLEQLSAVGLPFHFEITDCAAEFGGGALPGENIRSRGVAITSTRHTAAELDSILRSAPVPVIATIRRDRVILNVIAIEERDFDVIVKIFKGL